jgi:hypothetical protein
MGLYQICSNKSPWVKIDPTLGVIDFLYMHVVKTLKRILLIKPKELEPIYLA